MKKSLLFLFPLALLGQNTGQNVINLIIHAPSVITDAVTYTSANIQNIGQTSHQIQLIVTGATGPYNVSGAMQGSADCVNWFNIGPSFLKTSISSNATVTNITGYKSYPCLRGTVTIDPLSNPSMTVGVYYQGNSAPTVVLTDGLGVIDNQQIYSGSFDTQDGMVHALGISHASTQAITIYGIALNLPSTMTFLRLGCIDSAGIISGSTSTLVLRSFTDTTNYVLPVSLRPYYQCPVSQAYGYASSGTGNGTITVFYRTE